MRAILILLSIAFIYGSKLLTHAQNTPNLFYGPQNADLSKLLIFTCEFCSNLAESKNELDCERSRECAEVFDLCFAFENQCCTAEATDEDCIIITTKASQFLPDESDVFGMAKKRSFKKKRPFLKKREESMKETSSSDIDSDEIEKRNLKRLFPFKKRF